jgi:hypothetical protein
MQTLIDLLARRMEKAEIVLPVAMEPDALLDAQAANVRECSGNALVSIAADALEALGSADDAALCEAVTQMVVNGLRLAAMYDLPIQHCVAEYIARENPNPITKTKVPYDGAAIFAKYRKGEIRKHANASAAILAIAEKKEYCDRCDGCGWYEGGATLRTVCEKCNGTGIVSK